MMEIYRNQEYSFKERAANLVAQMTLEEKVTQVGAWTAAIPRLEIPAFHYANEASHGIFALNYFNSNTYDVTCFPVCLAMSQSWDREKMKKVTEAISDEARAFHNIYGDSLSFWCPTLNLARDPRNGRSDENFGEDPFLAGKMAVSYIQGLQGEDSKYKKTAAVPKHFALNSSENNRMDGISFADEATIREYYGKVFEYAFREGKAESVMISYNRINGVPAAANTYLLDTLLREEWGFDGYVTSDCSAVALTYANSFQPSQPPKRAHYYYRNEEEACAGTLIAGTDLSCGSEHRKHLLDAVRKGLVTEDIIDRAVIRNLTSLFRQGCFDNRQDVPWSHLTLADASTEANHALSADMASDTLVLLKNDKNILPLKTQEIQKILVVGPNAKFRELGGYSCGSMLKQLDTVVNVMAYDGLCQALKDTNIEVVYEKGWCSDKEIILKKQQEAEGLEALPGVNIMEIFESLGVTPDEHTDMEACIHAQPRNMVADPDAELDSEVLFARALDAAKSADVVLMVVGTDSGSGSEGADRMDLNLPNGQGKMIEKMMEINENTIVILETMGMVTDDVLDKSHTILNAHFAGEAQGSAIANVLLGKVNPNGKLTATWYKNAEDLPHINDYGLKKQDTLDGKGRTYMYFEESVRFPFGYGLSYTSYEYSGLKIEQKNIESGGTLKISVDVQNTGDVEGKEIIQLYIRKISKEIFGSNKPKRQLKGFEKISLKPMEKRTIKLEVPLKELTYWSNLSKRMEIEEGEYVAEVGGSSAQLPCSEHFAINGSWKPELSTVYAVAEKYVYEKGQKAKINVTATLEDTSRVNLEINNPIFTSSDTNVAVVDKYGMITAVGSGAASILISITYKEKTVSADIGIAVK